MQTMQNLRLSLLLRRARWPKHPTVAGVFWIGYFAVIAFIAVWGGKS